MVRDNGWSLRNSCLTLITDSESERRVSLSGRQTERGEMEEIRGNGERESVRKGVRV